MKKNCEILGSSGGVVKASSLLEFYTTSISKWILTVKRTVFAFIFTVENTKRVVGTFVTTDNFL